MEDEARAGFAPFLNERRRLDNAEDYSRMIGDANEESNPEKVSQAAEKISHLLAPLEQAVQSGELPGFQLHTTIDGLEVNITR